MRIVGHGAVTTVIVGASLYMAMYVTSRIRAAGIIY